LLPLKQQKPLQKKNLNSNFRFKNMLKRAGKFYPALFF